MGGCRLPVCLVFATILVLGSARQNITYLLPDDGCSLFPPVYVDDQLNYHFGYFGMELDPLCEDIEFHGRDAKETYPNEFTMCFTTFLYRDPYCSLQIDIMEGTAESDPIYTFNCSHKPPMHRKVCLQKNKNFIGRVRGGWGFEMSELNMFIEAPKVYKRFWEYSIVQAVSGVAGGTIVFCIVVGVVLFHQNKANVAKKKRQRLVPMHRVNKDKDYLGKADVTGSPSNEDSSKSTPGPSIEEKDRAENGKNSIESKIDKSKEAEKQMPKVKVDVARATSNGSMTKAEGTKETTVVRRNANKS